MNLHFLLDAACLPADVTEHYAADIWRNARLPGLKHYWQRAHVQQWTLDETRYAHITPFEWVLLQAFQANNTSGTGASALQALAALDGVQIDHDARWAVLSPVHFAIGQDGLTLQAAPLKLDMEQAHALAQAITPYLEEAELQLTVTHPQRWYVQGEWLADLQTSSLARAWGQTVAAHQPYGRARAVTLPPADSPPPSRLPMDALARRWRRLQNDIQMVWHTHPVTQNCEKNGILPANSAWIYHFKCDFIDQNKIPLPSIKNVLISDHELSQALARSQSLSVQPYTNLPQALAAAQGDDYYVVHDALRPALLAQDWGQWLAQFEALDTDWFSPALALRDSKQGVSQISLTLCGQHSVIHARWQPLDRLRFWRQSTLSTLREGEPI